MKNDSGIYGIRNRTTGHVYIGSSADRAEKGACP